MQVTLIELFQMIPDKRRSYSTVYELHFLLLFAILASLSGAIGYKSIARWIKVKKRILIKYFELNWKRSPSSSLLQDIFSKLDCYQLEEIVRAQGKMMLDSQSESRFVLSKEKSFLTIACDGKSINHSFDNNKDISPLQLLSFLDTEGKIILAHKEIDRKKNEIPAMQELLKELELPSVIYTTDAMHTQKETALIIQNQSSNFVMQVKNNQKQLLNEIKILVRKQEPLEEYQEAGTKFNRSRKEKRTVRIFTPIRERKLIGRINCPEWDKVIHYVIEVTRENEYKSYKRGILKKSKPNSKEVAYYIASGIDQRSIPTNQTLAQYLLKVIRSHWKIENSNHYVKDVVLKEDNSRIRNNVGAFARIRSLVLNIFNFTEVKSISEEIDINKWSDTRVFLKKIEKLNLLWRSHNKTIKSTNSS